jgi:hypothetical protein
LFNNRTPRPQAPVLLTLQQLAPFQPSQILLRKNRLTIIIHPPQTHRTQKPQSPKASVLVSRFFKHRLAVLTIKLQEHRQLQNQSQKAIPKRLKVDAASVTVKAQAANFVGYFEKEKQPTTHQGQLSINKYAKLTHGSKPPTKTQK